MTSVFGKGSHEITDSDKRFDVRVSLPFSTQDNAEPGSFQNKKKEGKKQKNKKQESGRERIMFLKPARGMQVARNMKEKDATLPFKMFSGQITGKRERNRHNTYTFFSYKTLRQGNNIHIPFNKYRNRKKYIIFSVCNCDEPKVK